MTPLMDRLDLTDIIARRAEYACCVFIALNTITGLRMTTNPIRAAEGLGHQVRRYTPAYSLMEGSGYTALSTALCLILIVSGVAPPQKAIPYSLLVRSFWLKRGVDGAFSMAGMRPSGRLRALAMVTGPGSALFLLIRPSEDNVESLLNALLVVTSSINIFSVLLFFAPNIAAPFFFGLAVSAQQKIKVKGFFRGYGEGSMINATLLTLFLLRFHISEAVGYTACLWGSLSFYAGFIARMDKELDIPQKRFLYQVMTAACFASALLL